MKDASVRLDGCCPTHTAASLHQAHPTPRKPPPPPPPSPTVQQLDPWGALLASTPTRGTPWCQNTEHSGIAQTARSRANRQKLSKTAQLCSQISTCLPANRHVWSIRVISDAKRCVLLVDLPWLCPHTGILTSDSLPIHNDSRDLMNSTPHAGAVQI